jgi:mRNA interferase MazF
MNDDKYIPDRGDIVWTVLNPRVGHEQSGRRPSIVLSRRLFSQRTGLVVICPITTKVKGLPFEIRIKSKNLAGAVLPIHIRSIDYNAREIRYIEKASIEILQKVSASVELIST